MRAVVQRVKSASVTVDERCVGAVGQGLLVFLGIGEGDDEEACRYLAQKIANLRIFADETGKMTRSVQESGGDLLVVSQFTLYGDCRKGRRPNFTRAARPDEAERLYRAFIDVLRSDGLGVEEGEFGAMMDVSIVNDGPVTLLLDTEGAF